MQYASLGRSHRISIQGVSVPIIHTLLSLFSILLALLTAVWWPSLSFWVAWMGFQTVGFFVGTATVMPFCKSLVFGPLRGRVAFDP